MHTLSIRPELNPLLGFMQTLASSISCSEMPEAVIVTKASSTARLSSGETRIWPDAVFRKERMSIGPSCERV